MEDDVDDKIVFQTIDLHLNIVYQILWTIFVPYVKFLKDVLKMLIMQKIFTVEIIVISFTGLLLLYLKSLDISYNNWIQKCYSKWLKEKKFKIICNIFNLRVDKKTTCKTKYQCSAVYSLQGKRSTMEDRFEINENIDNSGIGLYAIFDGHGGEFAANYVKENLINDIYQKISLISNLIYKKNSKQNECWSENSKDSKNYVIKNIYKKTIEIQPSSISKNPCDKKDVFGKYINNTGINFGELLIDEVLNTDNFLLEIAKKKLDYAGTTALIAIVHGSTLVVANVGDSRGVMCDYKGNAIPLSFDHKPQQVRERKRIKEAGGFVSFNGVWRVAGILATSRALGDYPLKEKKFLIADPDILTFNLTDHKPQFLILASDGLWDTFTNEEAVNFIKDHINESDFGAQSITMQSYYRGSLDNITVIVISCVKFNSTKDQDQRS